MPCHSDENLEIINAFFIKPMKNTPIIAPQIVPRPPARLAPPRITAVMACYSAPTPTVEVAVAIREA